MEGRRTRGRAAAEKAAVAAAASEQHVPQLSEPDEAEAEADETAGEPWRRPVTESVLRRIITIRPNVLRRQFGWRPQTGAPRMALSIAGQRLEAGVQTVMQFNKEGRDGFPWKSHWVGRLLDKLGPRLGDTLLLQKQRVDADGLIHVEGLLERWGSLGLEQQQQVFDAALVAAGQGAWPELEARLQAALGRPCDARS
ncbi:hypothetical protein C2E21_2483 [Chlorella sorokiniana]|uniref:Uncharacterized protein n=1 Tax=Chlorella sorokiniana TaxID=3076 RepID=A0A2P6TYB0_CHLSO|nr:hypothetical protein C2E21_2483 [Chlorella sorokiniana]|eukprot:PRW59043.1 hypothetical protein C2E21_2483 [Chlorella sorokiniana]